VINYCFETTDDKQTTAVNYSYLSLSHSGFNGLWEKLCQIFLQGSSTVGRRVCGYWYTYVLLRLLQQN